MFQCTPVPNTSEIPSGDNCLPRQHSILSENEISAAFYITSTLLLWRTLIINIGRWSKSLNDQATSIERCGIEMPQEPSISQEPL